MSKRCQYPPEEWPRCCSCDGRLHDPGCTSKRNKDKDCCPARHKMLHDRGYTRGLYDTSQAMWSEESPQGYHDPQPRRTWNGPADHPFKGHIERFLNQDPPHYNRRSQKKLQE